MRRRKLTMGEVQRIFYIHVPSAWTALTAYFLVFLGSVGYLWKRSPLADDLAHAAGEVGFVFCSGVLVTGPLWAKPVWGIWWTWDARLTLTFVLWLLFVSYLMLRSYVSSPGALQHLLPLWVSSDLWMSDRLYGDPLVADAASATRDCGRGGFRARPAHVVDFHGLRGRLSLLVQLPSCAALSAGQSAAGIERFPTSAGDALL